MQELRGLEDRENPVYLYRIKSGKILKNGIECMDDFNLQNQLFH